MSMNGRIMSMNNPNDTIGNRIRDLSHCSSVPEPKINKEINITPLTSQEKFYCVNNRCPPMVNDGRSCGPSCMAKVFKCVLHHFMSAYEI